MIISFAIVEMLVVLDLIRYNCRLD